MRAVRNTCSEYDDLAHRAGNIFGFNGWPIFLAYDLLEYTSELSGGHNRDASE